MVPVALKRCVLMHGSGRVELGACYLRSVIFFGLSLECTIIASAQRFCLLTLVSMFV